LLEVIGTRKPQDTQELFKCEADIAVVILARNEEAVLGKTLERLSPLINNSENIHVVADHCIDATADIARRAGVTVHIRTQGGPAGKGPALRWWLNRTQEKSTPSQVVIVLDADSFVATNFFPVVMKHASLGKEVLQTRVEPIFYTSQTIASLAALSEITDQRVYDALRARLGWPVRLRGTGMVFKRSVLETVSHRLHTLTEDVELSLLLSSRGIPISFVQETAVFDPKPCNETAAIHQRARWLKGQFQVLQSYPKEIGKLLLSGFPGWSLLGSVLLKPRSLMFIVKIVAATLSAILAGKYVEYAYFFLTISSVMILSIILHSVAILFSLRYLEKGGSAIKTLLSIPFFFLLWVRSFLLATVTNDLWLRSRPLVFTNVVTEPESAQ
jgi:cellulose synthase/poly-beta-1,6-N-acetylglucosamine synthase-like glycosyltransferase